MRHLSFLIIFIALYAVLPATAASLPPAGVKNLHITTDIVFKNAPTAVIVAPATGFLSLQSERIVENIRALTGVTITVVQDDIKPEEILKKHNVIAIGNMATNRFIEQLYRQWLVILDRTYPGKDGYVIRSLHDPYGTGHNVIFVGGSDDSGVVQATERFCTLLKPLPGNVLKLGWLMDIKLGQGMKLPEISSVKAQWQVFSWNDSWRKTSDGREVGYPPASYFGWNPISVAGVLYYMTGKKEYLDCFKELAMPDPGNIPTANRSDDAFTDPLNPLVKTYHYRSHLVPVIYDLIKESPLFTDRDRQFIATKLLEQQAEYDPTNTYRVANGDRHALWHLLNIYTGSRYFARHSPDPVWNQRIENVRASFRSFINNPTWSDRDTLYWVSTSIEPVFEFFMLDGYGEFTASGTARTMLKGLEILMTGDEVDNYNKYLSLGLLYRAASMTRDGRYVWMARRLGFDFKQFRIGQSYYPADNEGMAPPTDLIGEISVYPLAHTDWLDAQSPVPERDAFQILSYRTGLGKQDDYLLVDGFEGKGRHPYELNTISRLRLFGGKNILEGPANTLSIWHNGMAGDRAARSAALVSSFAADDLAFIRTEVPDMPASDWQRSILTLKDSAAIVIDKVTSRGSGHFDVVGTWQLASRGKPQEMPTRRVSLGNGVTVTAADSPFVGSADGVVKEHISRTLREGEVIARGTLFLPEAGSTTMDPVPGGYLLTDSVKAFVAAGAVANTELSIQAGFVYVDDKRLFLADGTACVVGGQQVFTADQPVSMQWNFHSGAVNITARTATRIRLLSSHGIEEVAVPAGDSRLVIVPPNDLSARVSSSVQRLEAASHPKSVPTEQHKEPRVTWMPLWELHLKGSVARISVDSAASAETLWMVSQGKDSAEIIHSDLTGRTLGKTTRPGELLSLWVPRDSSQAKAFGVLAGFRDDMLYAIADNGQELWRQKTEISPEFRIGDHYDAPWFTDPAALSGVSAILVGELGEKGRQEIVIGRPSTIEFRTMTGKLSAKVPVKWGTITSLAFLRRPGFLNYGKVLFAGKGFTGNPTITAVSGEHKKISDGYFDGLVPGYGDMHAWLQRGLGQMVVADLKQDGTEQLIFTLSGHWNELRVYDGRNNTPLWMKSFGPDKAGGGFMRGLQVVDLNGSGKKSVLVATRLGWVCAFDYQGKALWQRHFDAEITVIASSEKHGMTAIGCADGSLTLLDGTGALSAVGSMGTAVQSLAFGKDYVIAGSNGGLLRLYPYPPDRFIGNTRE